MLPKFRSFVRLIIRSFVRSFIVPIHRSFIITIHHSSFVHTNYSPSLFTITIHHYYLPSLFTITIHYYYLPLLFTITIHHLYYCSCCIVIGAFVPSRGGQICKSTPGGGARSQFRELSFPLHRISTTSSLDPFDA
jgi:hypothetical protein